MEYSRGIFLVNQGFGLAEAAEHTDHSSMSSIALASLLDNNEAIMNFQLPSYIWKLAVIVTPIFLISCGTGDTSTSSGTTSTVTTTNRHSGSPTVTLPNGGETWARGGTYEIKWDVGNVDTNIKVELLSGDALDTTISSAHYNGGVLRWEISSSLSPGSNYKIRITGINDATKTDTSDNTFELK